MNMHSLILLAIVAVVLACAIYIDTALVVRRAYRKMKDAQADEALRAMRYVDIRHSK